MDPLSFFVDKTEKVVNTGFLWLRILKALRKNGPVYAEQLRRQHLKPMPNRRSFEIYLFMMKRLGLVERDGYGRGSVWRITPKGEMVLDRAVQHLRQQMALLFES